MTTYFKSEQLPNKPLFLIIDDTEEDRARLRVDLIGAIPGQVEFLEASTIAEALELCRPGTERLPHVVFLDMQFPQGNSLDFLRQIRVLHGRMPFPVIVLTGSYDIRSGIPFLELGAQDVLLKRDIQPVSMGRVVFNACEQFVLQKQVRAGELLLRRTLDSLAPYVLLMDCDGHLRQANHTVFEATGLDPTDLVNRSLMDVLPAVIDTQRDDLAAAVVAAGRGRASRLDLMVRLPVGTRVLDLQLVPMIDDDEVSHIVVSGVDVTERVQADEALLDRTREMETLFNNVTVGLGIFDADRRFVRVNEELADISGRPPEEHLGQPLREMLPELARSLDPLIEATFRSGEPIHNLELSALTPRQPGTKRHWLCGFFPIFDGQGQVHRVCVMVIENTEQKRFERTLREARNRAEAASRTKSEFLASMSHEVRTPMTAILGLAEELYQQETNDANRDTLRTILQNGRYLTEILNDILDLSKIEAGRLDLEPMPCSPATVIFSVQSLMNVRVREKGIRFQLEFTTPIPRTVTIDPTRLRQILVNLVGNAIKFTHEGHVVIRVGVRGTAPSARLDIEVEDTGIGISREHLDEIFQPFTQIRNYHRTTLTGTGLGLAISRRLAEALGGHISVQSEPGRGSTFCLSLAVSARELEDVHKPHPAEAEPSTRPDSGNHDVLDPPPSLEGRRILVAEDTKTNQLLIRRIFEQAGAQVVIVEDGQAAVDQVRITQAESSPFDAVVMDMHMPIMDGYEAAGLIGRLDRTPPIIALTASAMEGDRERCLRAGCHGYVTKPIDRQRLIRETGRLIAEFQANPSDSSVHG